MFNCNRFYKNSIVFLIFIIYIFFKH